MVPGPRTRLAVASVLALAPLLAACSGSGAGSPSTPPSSAGRSASAPASDTQTSGAPLSLTEALLSASDVSGYRTSGVPDLGTRPLPCTPHAPGLASQFPPQSRAQLRFQSTTLRSSFQETLLGYPNSGSVADVYAAAQDGYNCSAGQVSGIDAAIARVRDVQGDGYRGERWDYRLANGALGTSVIGQVGRVFVSIDFVAAAGGSGEVNPDVVLRAALDRVRTTAPR